MKDFLIIMQTVLLIFTVSVSSAQSDEYTQENDTCLFPFTMICDGELRVDNTLIQKYGQKKLENVWESDEKVLSEKVVKTTYSTLGIFKKENIEVIYLTLKYDELVEAPPFYTSVETIDYTGVTLLVILIILDFLSTALGFNLILFFKDNRKDKKIIIIICICSTFLTAFVLIGFYLGTLIIPINIIIFIILGYLIGLLEMKIKDKLTISKIGKPGIPGFFHNIIFNLYILKK